jgi:GT2 family glycosyltransferase
VGIVSWNTAAHLDACLSALPAALGDVAAEVVVVDNASADESVAVARRRDVRVIVNDRNLGYAVAMNQALAGPPVRWLLALNPDTVPGPGSLQALVTMAEAHPDAGVIVPRLVDALGRPQPSAHRFPGALAPVVAALSSRSVRQSRVGRRLLLDGSGPHRSGPVDWAIGAVHLIRSSALDGEAPYSERSFMYAEDLDLCWRLHQRGAPTVLAGEVTIPHIGNVAGEQAWGDGRSARFWIATYDVVAQRRSPWAARWTALGGAVAALIAIVRSSLRGLVRRQPAEVRPLVSIRRRELAVHARVAIRGPLPPPVSAPGPAP